MKDKLYNILLALFWGIGGYSIAYIILESLFYSGSKIIELVIRQNLPLQILIALTYANILTYFGNNLIEEWVRFFIIKKLRIINPYGLLLGLSWALIENIYRYPEYPEGLSLTNVGMTLHIVNAGIICYFIKKNKPILGFVIAFMIHTGWNLFVGWDDFFSFF